MNVDFLKSIDFRDQVNTLIAIQNVIRNPITDQVQENHILTSVIIYVHLTVGYITIICILNI